MSEQMIDVIYAGPSSILLVDDWVLPAYTVTSIPKDLADRVIASREHAVMRVDIAKKTSVVTGSASSDDLPIGDRTKTE